MVKECCARWVSPAMTLNTPNSYSPPPRSQSFAGRANSFAQCVLWAQCLMRRWQASRMYRLEALRTNLELPADDRALRWPRLSRVSQTTTAQGRNNSNHAIVRTLRRQPEQPGVLLPISRSSACRLLHHRILLNMLQFVLLQLTFG